MAGFQWNEKSKRDAMVASGCGLGVALVTGITQFVIGSVAGTEAKFLVEAMMPTTRFLCSGVMTAAATILALMLTLLSFSVNLDNEFDSVHFNRIRQVAFYAMLTLVAATLILVIHCVPLQESDAIPSWLYPVVYYSLLVGAATLGGALVTVVIMLYMALSDLIHVVGVDKSDQPREPDAASSE